MAAFDIPIAGVIVCFVDAVAVQLFDGPHQQPFADVDRSQLVVEKHYVGYRCDVSYHPKNLD